MQPGVVYIIGAGPGDPDLITVRGLRLLQQAEVALYDRLVPRALLMETPQDCERIYVGKAAGVAAMPQEEIINLMIHHARANRRVVRLKGGDPYVFGRGGEEALALRAARVPFVVVPGVSSAVAVPALVGIPLTHQHLARGFAVVTGHTRHETYPASQRPQDDDPLGHLDLEALAAIDTVVVLMGVRRLAALSEGLQQAGRSPDTPVAIIENGATPKERLVCGRLADIAAKAAQASVQPPAVIVIGNVVALQPALQPTLKQLHSPTTSF
ncbi:MAG: uroporphyrinogen-III C-methyltransferase [Chloroflexi bacterium]|nr:uroporphyrinogen-III C-methyltransferase [Chloroflexota bacterium]